MARFRLGLIGLALLGCSLSVSAQIREVKVSGGRVEGEVIGELAQFKGIPFAAPPVGALRWKAPQAVASWKGLRKATAFGPACMQNPAALKNQAPGIAMSEDCLYLDVWTPAKSPAAKLPVIVWIYGGGFSGGMTSSPLYDGTNFAKQGVVFVSIAYRVGPFGFLATPELSRESARGSGNYGLLDQIAGLRWVRENVQRFGGDPDRVTLLGHSAGGFAVSMLAGSPLAKGLFRAAISESGASFTPPQDSPWAGTSIQTLRMAEQAGKTWLESLGANTLETARALPAEQVEAGQRAKGAARFWPPMDGYVIREDQVTAWRARRFNDTPILIGDVSDEAAGFGVRKTTAAAFEAEVRQGYGEKAGAILAVYPHANDDEATRSATQLRSDTTFVWGQYTWARLQAKHAKHPAWMYWFDRPSAANPNGSGHGQEAGYVFGNLGVGGRAQPNEEDRSVSAQMQGYWVNFAKTGNPNGAGLPDWPQFVADRPLVQRIGKNPGPALLPNEAQLKVLDEYYAWRRGDGVRP